MGGILKNVYAIGLGLFGGKEIFSVNFRSAYLTMSLEAVEEEMGVLPEGYRTLKMALDFAEKLHVPLPPARDLWDVIHGKVEAETFVFAFVRDFVE